MILETINMNVFMLVFTFIGVLSIGIVKAYQRITGSSEDTWDKTKFGWFVVVVSAIMILEYIGSKAITFPGDAVIGMIYNMTVPIFSIFGTAYVALTGGKIIKDSVVVPTIKDIKENSAVTTPTDATEENGFVLPRDGSKIFTGSDGWWCRINPSPQASSLPDEKCWQAVSPKTNYWSGDKETIIYLVSHPDAAGWRQRNA